MLFEVEADLEQDGQVFSLVPEASLLPFSAFHFPLCIALQPSLNKPTWPNLPTSMIPQPAVSAPSQEPLFSASSFCLSKPHAFSINIAHLAKHC